MIKIYKNFLDTPDIDKLINYAKNCNEEKWQVKESLPAKDFWQGRFIHACDVKDKEIQQLLITNRLNIIKEIKKAYKIEDGQKVMNYILMQILKNQMVPHTPSIIENMLALPI